jgi:Mn2+/Fe2+ NRAMP family transporter
MHEKKILYIRERWRQGNKTKFFHIFLNLLKGEKKESFSRIIKIVEAATIPLILMMVVCFLFKLFPFHVLELKIFVCEFFIVHHTRREMQRYAYFLIEIECLLFT